MRLVLAALLLLVGCSQEPPEDATTEIAFEAAWDAMTPGDRNVVCDGVRHYGLDYATSVMMEGAGPNSSLDPVVLRSRLKRECLG